MLLGLLDASQILSDILQLRVHILKRYSIGVHRDRVGRGLVKALWSLDDGARITLLKIDKQVILSQGLRLLLFARYVQLHD